MDCLYKQAAITSESPSRKNDKKKIYNGKICTDFNWNKTETCSKLPCALHQELKCSKIFFGVEKNAKSSWRTIAITKRYFAVKALIPKKEKCYDLHRVRNYFASWNEESYHNRYACNISNVSKTWIPTFAANRSSDHHPFPLVQGMKFSLFLEKLKVKEC